MARGAMDTQWAEYVVAAAMLVLALLFPVGLDGLQPHADVRAGLGAVRRDGHLLLGGPDARPGALRLWRNERAFEEAPELLKRVSSPAGRDRLRDGRIRSAAISDDERRILPRGVSASSSASSGRRAARRSTQLMEVNREGSGLDQEQVAGRFTLTRYILYLLPVIGFIGTVEGISRALMKISKVLPMVKELDGFLSNLTGVTSALQIAFDSTLLALFLSAA